MKRWLILAAVVIVGSASATMVMNYLPEAGSPGELKFPGASAPNGPQPEAVVDGDMTYKFDVLPQHEKINRDWVIHNKGKADLILTLEHTTCSCTVAEFPKDPKHPDANNKEIRVKPGDYTTLHLTFNTKEFTTYDQAANVGTNDPKHPQLTFGAKGTVRPAIVLFPPEKTIFFQTLSNDTDHSARLAMSSPDRPDFKITRIRSSKPNVIVADSVPLNDEARKQLKLTSGYQVNVTVKPGLPLGNFHEEVIVETNHPKQTEIRFAVIGKVAGPIAIVPEHLTMSNVHGPKGGRGNVTLMVRGFRDTKFEVEKKPEKLDVAVAQVGKPGQYKMTVTIPPGTSAANIQDTIVLKTDHPKAATVRIPVSIFIQGPSS